MTVSLDGETIRLDGDCQVEDADSLVSLLIAHPQSRVDLSGCGTMHAAVFQALLAVRPKLDGAPTDGFAREWLLPLLTTSLPGDDPAP